MTTLLIHNGWVLPCDGDMRQAHRPGYVLVRGERIEAVESGSPPEGLFAQADEVIDAAGKAVLPGLINAHTHLFQCFLRGLADDRPLLQWLAEATWPGGLAMTEHDFYLAALLGFVENLKCGATSVLDQDYVQTSPRNMDAVAEAAQRSGARVLLARGVGDREPYFAKFLEPAEVIMAETGRLIRRWNTGPTSRVRVEFGPMIPWGCRVETLQEIRRLANEWDVGVHIHVSESRDEVQMSLDEFGLPPVRWLDEIGALDERWQLVHCVWLTPEEMDIVAGRGSLIVHCPVSNMYLASGIAPVGEWRRRGIPVALATDGPGSNNSQDMMEVLKTTACLQKVGSMDAQALLPGDVLEMALARRRSRDAAGRPDRPAGARCARRHRPRQPGAAAHRAGALGRLRPGLQRQRQRRGHGHRRRRAARPRWQADPDRRGATGRRVPGRRRGDHRTRRHPDCSAVNRRMLSNPLRRCGRRSR